MSPAYQYYFITLLIFFGVNTIACWSLNIQYGVGGVMNFAFIMFQALGAYLGGVLTLGPSTGASFQQYIFGTTLPFPLPWIVAAAAGAALAWLVGSFALRPARRDFQAMVMLVVSIIASTVVLTEGWLFNGMNGIAAIPKPFQSRLSLGQIQYGWFYLGMTAVVVLLVYLLVDRLTGSPWGRRLRAMREHPEALSSLGVNIRAESMKVYVLGGALASLSGAILVQFIGAWSPGSWDTGETFLYFVAVIVGGAGNNFGAMLGAALVLGVFEESVRYLPSFGYAGLTEAVQFMLLGVLILAFLWFRPSGLVPERRRRLTRLLPAAGPAGGKPETGTDRPTAASP